jgi:hypothetical protein
LKLCFWLAGQPSRQPKNAGPEPSPVQDPISVNLRLGCRVCETVFFWG